MDIYDDESQGNGEGTGSGSENGVGLISERAFEFDKNQKSKSVFENKKNNTKFQNELAVELLQSTLISLKQLSKFLGKSENSIRFHIKMGRIKPSGKLGRCYLFNPKDVLAQLKRDVKS
jgi:predicted HTH domain antitoxin